MLRVVTDENKTHEYQERFAERMEDLASSVEEVTIGYQGGSSVENVWYYEDEGFWFIAAIDILNDKRYWNPAGLQNPREKKHVGSDVQICIPFVHDRGVAGVFLEDEHGNIYVGHRGRVNGVKKNHFLKNIVGSLELVEDSGKESKIIIISPLESDSILLNMRMFLDEVARIKDESKHGSSLKKTKFSFTDEPVSREPYEFNTIIEADLKHARVVNELRRLLQLKKHSVANTQQIDLMIYNSHTATHLFEVKSSCDTQSIYTAIGQLLLHSLDYPNADKILVITYGLSVEVKTKVLELGIKILNYRLTSHELKFSKFSNIGLIPALKRL